MTHYIKYLDIDGFKKAMAAEGSAVVNDFEHAMEGVLRLFVLRYRKITSGRSVESSNSDDWPYKSGKTIPNIIRSFFKNPIDADPVFYISLDVDFIRGWRKTMMAKNRNVKEADSLKPSDKAEISSLVTRVREGMNSGADPIVSVPDIVSLIPKTRRLRNGAYKYLAVWKEPDGSIRFKRAENKESSYEKSGFILSGPGRDHLHVFMTQDRSARVAFVEGRKSAILYNANVMLCTR